MISRPPEAALQPHESRPALLGAGRHAAHGRAQLIREYIYRYGAISPQGRHLRLFDHAGDAVFNPVTASGSL
jgi:hypothetical protein